MTLLEHKGRHVDLLDWPLSSLPSFRWLDELTRDADGAHVIDVEEFVEDGTLVVRAELPGFDPDRDVTVTVEDGLLKIVARRETTEEDDKRAFRRRELRYGAFARTVVLPDGADESAVTATAKDGILEVRVPMATTAAEPARTIAITRS